MLVEIGGKQIIADCSFATVLRYRRDFGKSLFLGDITEFALLYTATRQRCSFDSFCRRLRAAEMTELEAKLAEALILRECVRCKSKITPQADKNSTPTTSEKLDIEGTVLRLMALTQMPSAALNYCTLDELLEATTNKHKRRMATPNEMRDLFPEV